MGHNYYISNRNMRKPVRFKNYIEFLIQWRKPHRSSSICSEMRSKKRLLPHGKNDKKNCSLNSAVLSNKSSQTNNFKRRNGTWIRRQSVGLVWKQSCLESISLPWYNTKKMLCRCQDYNSITRLMKAVVDASRDHTNYRLLF